MRDEVTPGERAEKVDTVDQVDTVDRKTNRKDKMSKKVKKAPEMIREDSGIRVSELMRRKGCTGAHCGNCAKWLTPWKAEDDGELLGWIGVCCDVQTDEVETEADDYCPRHEYDWVAGPDGKRYYLGMGGCPSTPRLTEKDTTRE